MATKTLNFAEIVNKAKRGEYKLPSFQRGWKWEVKQVKLFYESIRLTYPIGSFLVMTSQESELLAPKAFHGSGRRAEENKNLECLVLDGQQRITAGINLYYGLDDIEKGSEYYIDLNKIKAIFKLSNTNIEEEDKVKEFCDGLDVMEHGYLVNKPKRFDRRANFVKDKLIWTGYLTKEKQDDLDEIIELCKDNGDKKIIKRLLRKNLMTDLNVQVPVIELGKEFGLTAISRVFTTINTTGKLLTPFELVVAILYPYGINIAEDIKLLKLENKYYNYMDKNGEILLQTIALLSNSSPKKSDLPKNINKENYNQYKEDAVTLLNSLGEYLSDKLGMGLDSTEKLIPYDAIFAPMALVLKYIEDNINDHTNKSKAKRKIDIWFIASVLSQRYQEGVHAKQTKDKDEMIEWIKDEKLKPQWITGTYISPVIIKNAIPSGAIGKMIMCLINKEMPKDPIADRLIGFRDGAYSTEFHHIYPSRWAPKGLKDYNESIKLNVALNIMFLSTKTNADWLNFDPKQSISLVRNIYNDPKDIIKFFNSQYISKEAIENLEKLDKTVKDYQEFISIRYNTILETLKSYGFKEASQDEYTDEQLNNNENLVDD
ncbi:hypothetical protein LX87_02495 [Larkinella arboricola]|uniref:GmrSD restriction endonucleases N-terminal domain-containing protein n=1 Tax=Larkinella arboricola TaxID=643671 RepID=A0A327WWA3_LARAB|nr:DUF262 domain-containing protein [Larkinella arboricola]RAJ97592.1 hypothetical protein LX87_02495 [Larkinella arboricola]